MKKLTLYIFVVMLIAACGNSENKDAKTPNESKPKASQESTPSSDQTDKLEKMSLELDAAEKELNDILNDLEQ